MLRSFLISVSGVAFAFSVGYAAHSRSWGYATYFGVVFLVALIAAVKND